MFRPKPRTSTGLTEDDLDRQLLQDAKDAARRCLTLDDFKAYKEKAVRAQAVIQAKILALDEKDPVVYAFKIRELINDWKHVMFLNNVIDKDSKRIIPEVQHAKK